MDQLLLINPRRKRRKNPKARRSRHKNARRRRVARAGGVRIQRRRVKNPRARHHRRRRNPRMRRRHYRRHRNPVSMSGIKAALIPAAFGAAGGVVLDIGYNYLSPYIPASITGMSPYMANVLKIAGAFGIGMLARKFLGSEKGNAVLAGALTIQIYNLAATAMGGTAGMAGLSAYLRPGMSGLGSPNPATYLRGLGQVGRIGRLGAYMQPAAVGMSGFGGMGALGVMPGSMSTDMAN